MAVNKRKILESARKHAQKGAQAKALKDYERLLKLDPSDAKLRLEIGDAYRRWGKVDDAVSTYAKVAEQYMKEGFDARAVAVYKQIQNLDVEALQTYEPLAELYQRMALTAEAIQALQTAAEGYQKKGRKREALEILRKMAALDPTNTTTRLKVADLLRQEGLNEDAVTEYREVVVELERQGDVEAAARACERVLEIDPDRVETLSALAMNLVGRGLADRAEPHVKRALELRPETPEILEQLAEVYRAQNRDEELAATYRQLADVYRGRGDEEKAKEIIQRFVPPDTFDASSLDSGAELGGVDEIQPDPAAFFEGGATLDGASLGEDDLLAEDAVLGGGDEFLEFAGGDEIELEDSLVEAPAAVEAAAPELSDAPAREPEAAPADEEPLPEGEPDQLLAEASVYLRYGKREQAIANLKGVLVQEPRHRAALEKLGEAYADGGDSELAVTTWLQAAEIARAAGDSDVLRVLRGRIGALDEEAAARLDNLPAAPPPAPAPAAPSPEPMTPDQAESTVWGGDGQGGESELELGDIEIDIDEGSFGAGDDIAAGPDPVTESESADAPPPAVDSDALVSGPGASSSTSQQIVEDLEEADFYIQQGLTQEAETIFQRVLSIAPNHPHALVRLGEIAALRGEDPGASGTGFVSPPEEPPSPTEALAEDPAPDPAPDLDEVEAPALDDFDLDTAEPPAAAAEDDDTGVDLDVDVEVEEEVFAEEPPATEPLPEPEPELEPEPQPAIEPPLEPVAAAPPELESPAPDPVLPDVAAAAPSAAAAGDPFDLAAELSDALDDDSKGSSSSGSGADDGFAAVFREFKKGVSNALSEGDHDTHYDLGIAYREMGLFDDAAAEFRTAVESPRRLEALHMLGLCVLDADRAEEAVSHFDEIIGAAGATDEQRLAARFELGRAHEALGDVGAARAAWEEVAAVDSEFCEVGSRLEKLAESPGDPGEASADEDFESFEDVMADVSDEDDADEVEAAEPESYESFDDVMSDVDDDSFAEPDAAVEPEPAPGAPGLEDAPVRKKKKISFV